jgi:hypothetical protein
MEPPGNEAEVLGTGARRSMQRMATAHTRETIVSLKDAVFRDMTTPYSSCKNRRFRGAYRLLLQGKIL